jgi:1,4-alpha-glucan branching enzyme
MTDADIAAIVQGRYSDPFGILGPHKVDAPAGGSQTAGAIQQAEWEVRAFLPGVESAALLIKNDRLPMSNDVHPEFFTIKLAAEPGPYRIAFRGKLPDSEEIEIEDPYRFPPMITPYDLYLHGEGNNFESWKMLGAHPVELEGVPGYRFAVWAPNAEVVSLTGDFNFWNPRQHPMRLRDGGIWEFFMPHLGAGKPYKFNVRSRLTQHNHLKADPFAFATEVPPANASITTDITGYQWNDAEWMEKRAAFRWQHEPMSVYEVHLESWMHNAEGGSLTYRELAQRLVEYVKRNGFTHIELLPIMEFPYSGSWGYQVTGYFAPTSRFGSPLDFKHFVDVFHQNGLGVIVDWVPGHFPKDAFGLARFDGTALYEHSDPRLGEHTDWGTLIFNYGRNEVRGFLISNGLFWLKEYHIDGLRVDAVASMLYLDYSRKPGEWLPNKYGGNENLEAIVFLRRFNELAHEIPGAMTIAEESTSFPGVSKPVYLNGLGFTMKWNMGWMHDMLRYIEQDPVHRKYHHNDITFSLLYSFTENFMLPISHDEVVHGKRSLLAKMPGDEWQRFANARAFLGYMFGHPGKKLLFMGCELGVYEEWDYRASLRWDVLQYKYHHGLQSFVREMNRFYRAEPALHELDFHYTGFEWIDFHDVQSSMICFLRKAEDPKNFLLFCCNFTPVVHEGYEIGIPEAGSYEEVMNSDATHYGGSGVTNQETIHSIPENRHGRPNHIKVRVPPLAVIAFRPVGR